MSFSVTSEFPVGEDHIWAEKRHPVGDHMQARPCLFLDRDGVIVEEVNYLHRVEDVRLIEGVGAVINRAHAQGYLVIIVTNQSGLARDMFDWSAFWQVQNEMHRLLSQQEAAYVDGVYACPFHKTGKKPFQHDNHPDRKPNPGMILRAQKTFHLDLSRSLIVGDKASDLNAGFQAGLAKGVHVLTGHGSEEKEKVQVKELIQHDFSVETRASIAGLNF